jgi:hypothetical protein
MMNELELMMQHYNKTFQGWTMGRFAVTQDEEHIIMFLEKDGEKKIAFLLSDPEGNDVGFLAEGIYHG